MSTHILLGDMSKQETPYQAMCRRWLEQDVGKPVSNSLEKDPEDSDFDVMGIIGDLLRQEQKQPEEQEQLEEQQLEEEEYNSTSSDSDTQEDQDQEPEPEIEEEEQEEQEQEQYQQPFPDPFYYAHPYYPSPPWHFAYYFPMMPTPMPIPMPLEESVPEPARQLEIAPKPTGSNSKACRYGADCYRQSCRYEHPEGWVPPHLRTHPMRPVQMRSRPRRKQRFEME